MTASTVFLSAGDVTAKYLSSAMPAVQIAWMRYLGFLLVLLPVVVARGPSRVVRSSRPGLQLLRALGLLGSTLFFFSALAYLAVPELTAIFFIAPLMVTALSAPILGESVGIARDGRRRLWDSSELSSSSGPEARRSKRRPFLPIMGALCWASTLMFTCRLGGIDPPLTTLTFSALVGFVLLSALVWIAWAPLSWPQLMMGALIGIASVTGYYLVILAYRHGDASVLSPYVYSQLIWATAFSWSVFGSIPELVDLCRRCGDYRKRSFHGVPRTVATSGRSLGLCEGA